MTCTNGQCEYTPTLQRETTEQDKDCRRYGQLWAEIEMPKLLADQTDQRTNTTNYNEQQLGKAQLDGTTSTQKTITTTKTETTTAKETTHLSDNKCFPDNRTHCNPLLNLHPSGQLCIAFTHSRATKTKNTQFSRPFNTNRRNVAIDQCKSPYWNKPRRKEVKNNE